MIIRRAKKIDMTGINKLLCQVLMVHHNGRPDLFKGDVKKYTDEELLDVCKQFEAYFLEQVFKEMQKTVDCFKPEGSESDPNNTLVDFFKDSTVQELAATSTEIQGLGLAQTLYEQMKRNYNL